MSKHDGWAPPGAGEPTRSGAEGVVDRQAGSWRRGVPDGMVISVDASGDRSTVRLIGDLDLASAPQVRWALPRLAGRALVVDLSRLAFIDAAGLSSLLLVRRHLERTGRRLHLHGAHGGVRRVFELSGLGHLVEEAA
jgi:anti-anti-sigma factor